MSKRQQAFAAFQASRGSRLGPSFVKAPTITARAPTAPRRPERPERDVDALVEKVLATERVDDDPIERIAFRLLRHEQRIAKLERA